MTIAATEKGGKRMKIKIVEKDSFWELENAINFILAKLSPQDIIDIKYSGNGARPTYGFNKYSAMIILKE